MLGYLPQGILLCLIIYDLTMVWRQRAKMRVVFFPEAVIGWITILVLLFFGGFFAHLFR
jgi:hypothetical protein